MFDRDSEKKREKKKHGVVFNGTDALSVWETAMAPKKGGKKGAKKAKEGESRPSTAGASGGEGGGGGGASVEGIQEAVKTLQAEKEFEQRERNYFQLERDKINGFWEITKHEVDELRWVPVSWLSLSVGGRTG